MEKFLYRQNLNKNPKINIYFAFPAIESFALASLGYLSIFKQLDEMENVAAERIYTDTKTTKIPIKQVDAIGFSNSFEIDFLAILKILEKFKIPFKYSDRDDSHPLVFAGGPVLSANPLPFQEFYDFIIIGDAKGAFDEVFEILINKANKPKERILKDLDKLKYVWVPAFGTKKSVKKATDVLLEPVCTPILSDKSFFKDTFIIETERGCPKMCNFCLASWGNLPTRFVPVDKILEAIDFGLLHTRKIALLGAYVAGHPDFNLILKHLGEKNKIEPLSLTLSSLRADLKDPDVIKTLVECGGKTATVAIEAGSERLRKIINKDLTRDEIFKTVEMARENGLNGLKMYVMIGHPGEDDEDIKELITLMKDLKQANKGFDLTLSLTTFVPKAQTPFQWCKKDSTKDLERKISYLKKEMHKIGVSLRPSSVEWDAVQAILSRWGASLADYLIEVYKKGGNLGAFKQVWRTLDMPVTFEEAACGVFCSTEKGTFLPCPLDGGSSALPWDFIECAPKEALRRAYDRALSLINS